MAKGLSSNWEKDLSNDLAQEKEFFPTLLGLPVELIRRIIHFACPGDTKAHLVTLQSFITYDLIGQVCRQLRGLVQDVAFKEDFMKRMLTTRMGLGRPTALRKDPYADIGGRLVSKLKKTGSMKRLPWTENRADDIVKLFPKPKKLMGLTQFYVKEWEGHVEFPAAEWYPLQVGVVLDEAATNGQTITRSTPNGFYEDGFIDPLDQFSQILRAPDEQLDPARSQDESVGITFASHPAMVKMSIAVFLGVLYLGTVKIENEDGVTFRDQDDALGKFMDGVLSSDRQEALESLVTNVEFLKPTTTIRDTVFTLADPMPSFLPAVVDGTTAVVFDAKADEEEEDEVMMEIGEMDVSELFSYYEDEDEEDAISEEEGDAEEWEDEEEDEDESEED